MKIYQSKYTCVNDQRHYLFLILENRYATVDHSRVEPDTYRRDSLWAITDQEVLIYESTSTST